MNILLIGYGKMGKEIEEVALSRNHTISHIFNSNDKENFEQIKETAVDVAIEFTEPNSAYCNIKSCLQNNIPIVSGTTGWLKKMEEVKRICKDSNGSFFYASNFSLGVNLFFMINKYVAKLMEKYSDYNIQIKEIHHTQKKDAPSGTAVTLAEQILEEITRKKDWVLGETSSKNELSILAERVDDIPGTHFIAYDNKIDQIELKHTAKSRKGFALGAILAAEWIIGKKGFFGMEDMLSNIEM